MSREALSLEISQVVARVVSGEPIDLTERGKQLAKKYPDLGMTPEMIREAIQRAAGMVGMIKNASQQREDLHEPATVEPAVPPPPPPAPLPAFVAEPPPAAKHKPAPQLSDTIERDLAHAIDQEIGNLVTGRITPLPKAIIPKGVATSSEDVEEEAPEPAAEEPRRFAPVAALRRAFQRH